MARRIAICRRNSAHPSCHRFLAHRARPLQRTAAMHFRRLVASLLLTTAAGCDARVVRSTPSNPVRAEWTDEIRLPPPHAVDVFFVVDAVVASAERARQAEIVATFVRGLVTGDIDADGQLEIQPKADVRVMIVPDDPTILRPDEIPEFEYSFTRGDDATSFIERVRTAAAQGFADASPWPQPLEAALFALTRGCVPRRNADAAIVFLQTQDDCSLADPDLADPSSTRYTGTPHERCARYPEALQPASRYEALFRRTDTTPMRPIDVTMFVGPATIAAPPSSNAIGAARADGEPSCTTPAGAAAYPAPRMLALAAMHPEFGSVASICSRDVIESMHDAMLVLGPSDQSVGCVPRTDVDFAQCEVRESLPADANVRCSDLPGREPIDEFDGWSVCRVPRVDSYLGREIGWSETGGAPRWECPYGGSYMAFTRAFVAHPQGVYRLLCGQALR